MTCLEAYASVCKLKRKSISGLAWRRHYRDSFSDSGNCCPFALTEQLFYKPPTRRLIDCGNSSLCCARCVEQLAPNFRTNGATRMDWIGSACRLFDSESFCCQEKSWRIATAVGGADGTSFLKTSPSTARLIIGWSPPTTATATTTITRETKASRNQIAAFKFCWRKQKSCRQLAVFLSCVRSTLSSVWLAGGSDFGEQKVVQP